MFDEGAGTDKEGCIIVHIDLKYHEFDTPEGDTGGIECE